MSVWTANALAWGAGVWLGFGPSYRGVSVTPVLPGGSGGEVTHSTATLIEVNGVDVVLWLLVPVLLTIIALLAVYLVNPGQANRKILLWCTGLRCWFFARWRFSRSVSSTCRLPSPFWSQPSPTPCRGGGCGQGRDT